jgi:hypothetical protein
MWLNKFRAERIEQSDFSVIMTIIKKATSICFSMSLNKLLMRQYSNWPNNWIEEVTNLLSLFSEKNLNDSLFS